MNNQNGFHTIARTAQGNLAICHIASGRQFAQVIPTDIRIFRRFRVRRRLAAAFARHDVKFLRVEGDVRFDVDLFDAIKRAAAKTATKVL